MARSSARRRRGAAAEASAGVPCWSSTTTPAPAELSPDPFRRPAAGGRRRPAREALVALEACAPDVIISDIGMPDGNGYELIESVRAAEHGSRLPAVALTAYARPEDRDRAIRAGFQLHVSKPIDPAALVRAVALVCGRGMSA